MTSDETSADGSESDEDTLLPSEFAGGDVLEVVVMVMSILLVVGVLGYLVSQAIVTPAAPEPTAGVESIEPFHTGEPGTDTVQVTVSLVNEGETGLQAVEVVVHCGGVERSLVFAHVPANGYRRGTVICDRGTTPTVHVVAWVES